MNKKIFRRIMIPCYVQFAICIVFWMCVGCGISAPKETVIYIIMTLVTICSVIIMMSVIITERLYISDVQDSLSALEQLNTKLRKQRHEYLNEMQVVYGLLEVNEPDEALKYLKPVYEDISRVGKALKTSRPALNALLYSKMEQAKKKDISLSVEVSSDLKHMNIPQWDMCKIFANIIDNAITALEDYDEQENKKINVQISENSGEYLFIISNNGPVIPKEKIQQIFKNGYTSKRGEGHGLGLGIVRDIVDEYNGVIEISSKINRTSFGVCIPKRGHY